MRGFAPARPFGRLRAGEVSFDGLRTGFGFGKNADPKGNDTPYRDLLYLYLPRPKIYTPPP